MNSTKRTCTITGGASGKRFPTNYLRTLSSLAVVCLAVGAFHSGWAVPASPDDVEVAQPDGTKFRLQLRGDEFFSWHETDEGYAIVKDPADGFWKYAQPAVDRAEFRAIAGARVGTADPAQLGLLKEALPEAALLRTHIQEQRRTQFGAPVEQSVPSAPAAPSPVEPPPSEPPARIPVSGTNTVKNIVILACFADHWDEGANTVLSSKGRTAVSDYANLFNEINHTADGAVGSVRDYYEEVSYGKLTIESVVTAWVELPEDEAFYGANDGNGNDLNPRQMVVDAINAAETAGFDFSQADSDGDGWVDSLTIIHSGHGEELGGNPSTCIWSHQWAMSGVLTKDGVKMYRYHTEPALRDGTSSTSIIRIGVICHEMGHFFGLPDLYDYSGGTLGLGKWCLMAGGSWNGSSGSSPAHFSAWCKVFLGFVSPFLVHSQSGLSLARVEDNPVVGVLRDGTSNGEYFLIENRAKTGFDNTSQIYPGMLIYHVDSKSDNNDLGSWPHPLVKIEEADGDNSLGIKTASSESGDVWTSTSGLAGGFRDQTGNQSANAMLYQAAHDYNRTDSSTYYSYSRLANFSAAGSTMTCDVSSLKTTAGSQTVASSSYTVSWPACSEATKYELQEGARTTLTSFSDGAEEEDAMYENWSIGGTVKRDSGGSHAGSYSYSMLSSGASVQSLTLRKSFTVTASTAISFYLWSHIYQDNGYLKCQISNDGGNTWQTLLTTYNSSAVNNTLQSFNNAAIAAAGISTGDTCILRFIVNIEYGLGWSAWPAFGYALDDISITGTEMDGYDSWTTLDDNVTETEYDLTGKAHGIHAYRVRASVNSTWQDYGPEGEVTVNNSPAAADLTLAAAKNGSATFPLGKYGNDPDGDALTVTFSSFSQGGQASYDNGTITYTPAPGVQGTETFTYTITDAFGASVSRTVTATVSPPAGSGANILSAIYDSENQTATITFAGIPGATYTLQFTTDLDSASWTPVGDNVALPPLGESSAGRATVIQTSAPSSAFYRTIYVSGP